MNANQVSVRQLVLVCVVLVWSWASDSTASAQSDHQESQGDIVFILDCSKSMAAQVSNDKTRFIVAQEALKDLIHKLGDAQKYRLSLYAFGHRGGFRIGSNGNLIVSAGKFETTNPTVHPFNDCERLFSLNENEGAVASEDDVEKMIDQIADCQPRGITPLYYSIQTAAVGEFDRIKSDRIRTIIVLTDGENHQFEGARGNQEHQKMSLPTGKKIADAVSNEDASDALDGRGVKLVVVRISDDGTTSNAEQESLRSAGADTVVSVKGSDPEAIVDAVLAAKSSLDLADARTRNSNATAHSMRVKVKIASRSLESGQQPDLVIEPADGVEIKRIAADTFEFSGLAAGVEYTVTGNYKLPVSGFNVETEGTLTWTPSGDSGESATVTKTLTLQRK